MLRPGPGCNSVPVNCLLDFREGKIHRGLHQRCATKGREKKGRGKKGSERANDGRKGEGGKGKERGYGPVVTSAT